MAFPIMVRGRVVRTDANGLIRLNDIHNAAGLKTNRRPSDWQALEVTKRLIIKTVEKIAGKSGNLTKTDIKSVIYAKVGDAGGTFAHPVLALAYSEFLSADLAYEVRDIFLRYKAADPTLADDILERASPEANEWAGTRAMGRAKRRAFTATLQSHGVVGAGYAICTNETYRALFDGTAQQLKQKKNLPAAANLRDNMDKSELVFVMAAEVLATERIEEESAAGNSECQKATGRSAEFIRKAIEADRKDRKRRLL